MSFKYVIDRMNCSDVKRGQNLEAKVEAKNNYDLRLLPKKSTKFPNFTRFLPEKCPIT